ncbi:MAG: DUF5074 domain-containing protein [Muribaculaceae bacterium]|nr:DUF5074 domain-containing protein [Muribaculaceae bacterium]
MKHLLIGIFLLPAAIGQPVAAGEADYTQGIIWVNEDWYGHQNSTVNYLLPDDPDGNYWTYRIIQTENPGMELGCTNQYGALWDGRLYLIAKQDKDPGASITGGRITVADAATMKILHQQSLIDPSGAQCDGRGFIGVDAHKSYISTSNGVWIFDLDTYTVTGQVAGSANPNAGGDNDKPNTDPTGALYHGQSGMMVRAAGKVFVAHQQYGLLVVDPAEDKVTDVLSMDIVQEGAGIGSIVKSKDGALWLSVAKNLQGTGSFLNCIVRVQPETLAWEIIEVPEGMYPPSNSWYAWTPDAFVASEVQNCLYWKGGPNRWFTGTKIYKFDCDTREQTLFIDLEEEGANWKLYGCAIGVHPITDEIYMALYHEFGTPTYITRRYSPAGEKIRDYEMIMNYWFPSLPVFPQSSGISGITEVVPGMNELSAAQGDVFRADGTLVARGVRFGGWAGIGPGLFIWKSSAGTRKILIK